MCEQVFPCIKKCLCLLLFVIISIIISVVIFFYYFDTSSWILENYYNLLHEKNINRKINKEEKKIEQQQQYNQWSEENLEKKYFIQIEDGFSVVFKKDMFEINNIQMKVFSFLSKGLLKFKQKELVLIIEYNSASKGMIDSNTGLLNHEHEFCQQILKYFELVVNQAKKSNLVTESGFTQLITKDQDSSKFLNNFPGIIYSPIIFSFPKRFNIIDDKKNDYLLCILVTEEELEVYHIFGPTRLLSYFSSKPPLKIFPVKFWNDIGRKSISKDDLISSKKLVDYFKKIGRFSHIIGVRLDHGKSLQMIIPSIQKSKIHKFVNNVKNKMRMFFWGKINQDSDSHLCLGGDDGYIYSSSSQEKKERLGGSFITFVKLIEEEKENKSKEEEKIKIVEDGFFVYLKKKKYEEFMESLRDGKPFKTNISTTTKTFELIWSKKEQKKKKKKKKEMVELINIELLSPRSDFKIRKVTPFILEEFIESLIKKSLVFFEKRFISRKKKGISTKGEEEKVVYTDWFDFEIILKILEGKKHTNFLWRVSKPQFEEFMTEYIDYLSKEFAVFVPCDSIGPEISVKFQIRGNIF